MRRPLGGLGYKTRVVCLMISGNYSKLSKKQLQQIRSERHFFEK